MDGIIDGGGIERTRAEERNVPRGMEARMMKLVKE